MERVQKYKWVKNLPPINLEPKSDAQLLFVRSLLVLVLCNLTEGRPTTISQKTRQSYAQFCWRWLPGAARHGVQRVGSGSVFRWRSSHWNVLLWCAGKIVTSSEFRGAEKTFVNILNELNCGRPARPGCASCSKKCSDKNSFRVQFLPGDTGDIQWKSR